MPRSIWIEYLEVYLFCFPTEPENGRSRLVSNYLSDIFCLEKKTTFLFTKVVLYLSNVTGIYFVKLALQFLI